MFESVLERIWFAVMHALYRFNLRAVRSVKLGALSGMLGFKLPYKPLIPWKYSKPRTKHCLVFHWGYAKIKDRYQPD